MTGRTTIEDKSVSSFAPDAKWIKKRNSSHGADKYIQQLFRPTIPTGEKEKAKYNYKAIFDHPPFAAVSWTVEVLTNRKRQRTERKTSRKSKDQGIIIESWAARIFLS
jgi:hypothetical protein